MCRSAARPGSARRSRRCSTRCPGWSGRITGTPPSRVKLAFTGWPSTSAKARRRVAAALASSKVDGHGAVGAAAELDPGAELVGRDRAVAPARADLDGLAHERLGGVGGVLRRPSSVPTGGIGLDLELEAQRVGVLRHRGLGDAREPLGDLGGVETLAVDRPARPRTRRRRARRWARWAACARRPRGRRPWPRPARRSPGTGRAPRARRRATWPRRRAGPSKNELSPTSSALSVVRLLVDHRPRSPAVVSYTTSSDRPARRACRRARWPTSLDPAGELVLAQPADVGAGQLHVAGDLPGAGVDRPGDHEHEQHDNDGTRSDGQHPAPPRRSALARGGGVRPKCAGRAAASGSGSTTRGASADVSVPTSSMGAPILPRGPRRSEFTLESRPGLIPSATDH